MVSTLSPARGHIAQISGGLIVFRPAGTNYQLQLAVDRPLDNAGGQLVEGTIRVRARKVWTVPSGGNFIQPIVGPPRIAQGRVVQLDEKQMVVQAGTTITVSLPSEDSAYSLADGPLAPGALVNVTLEPGAQFEAGGERAS
jgi:hypothetical protein